MRTKSTSSQPEAAALAAILRKLVNECQRMEAATRTPAAPPNQDMMLGFYAGALAALICILEKR